MRHDPSFGAACLSIILSFTMWKKKDPGFRVSVTEKLFPISYQERTRPKFRCRAVQASWAHVNPLWQQSKDGNLRSSDMACVTTASLRPLLGVHWRVGNATSAKEILDPQRQNVNVPANTGTAHNVLHLLWECEIAENFWKNVCNWINQSAVPSVNIEVTEKVEILGMEKSETELTASVLKKRSKTHKRLKERFLLRRNRTKRANFRGNPLF